MVEESFDVMMTQTIKVHNDDGDDDL